MYTRIWKLSVLLLVLCGGLTTAVAPGQTGKIDDETFVRRTKLWQKNRVDGLKKPTGWLSIVGLHWLTEGKTTFGTDPSNDVVFPKGPANIGAFHLADGKVTIEINAGVEVLWDGKPVTSMTVRDDHDPEGRTTLEMGSVSWYIIKRSDWLGVRIKDTESELRRNFTGIETFPIDRTWAVPARFEAYDPPMFVTYSDVTGNTTRQVSPGALVFEIDGKTYRLDPVFEGGMRDSLYLVLGDATNGYETYGGGRELYVPLPDENGKTVIDFNRSKNPPCAFNDYTTCWLPLPQNMLPIRVTAGEKVFEKKGKK